MKPPFFSVIMPVHNKAGHLGRALDSVLNQGFEDFELIIIDDASTDKSPEFIRRVRDARVRKYRRMVPGPGGYAARNLGISLARAGWIAFLDADDEWLEHHLHLVHEYLAAHPESDALATGFYLARGQEWIKDSYTRTSPEAPGAYVLDTYLQARLKGLELISTNTIVLKKKWLENVRFFPRAGPSGEGTRIPG
ncbi:MAG: glycosyltransferase family 2 protein [Desulfonatronovibrionaceae bacterium]